MRQITKTEGNVHCIMHFRINVVACAHPDYDWIGGIELGLHEKHQSQSDTKGFYEKIQVARG